MFETPILFLIFNRPDVTQRVFEEIKKQKPKFLFIAADGPRENKEGELEKCLQTREIINLIDWDCELKTLFREKNLGCRNAVSSAIDWFFENVESGIILEDDTLPHPDFFRFCEELLIKYKDDERIWLITGTNSLKETDLTGNYSYLFSGYVRNSLFEYFKISFATFPAALCCSSSICAIFEYFSDFSNLGKINAFSSGA